MTTTMKHRKTLKLGGMLAMLLMSSCAPACETGGDTSGGGGNGGSTPGQPQPESVLNCNDLVGVDQFGRSFTTVSSLRQDRQVGIFYWPWIGQPYATGIYDATKIAALPNGLDILTDFNSYDANISPDGQAHYWGEPLWGYYNSEDEWVIRKQMQMLTAAGIDFIYFDTTNALIYANVFLKVCAVLSEMIEQGWDAPQVVFYTHSHSLDTIRALYETLYKPNLYPETWYRKEGKPVIIGYTEKADDLREAASRGDSGYNPAELSAEILDFFYFFKAQWPSDPVYPDGFPWVEWSFPQPYHSESQVMNVTVASHPMVPMSFSLTRENWTNWGRGYDPDSGQNISADVDRGTFFQREWDRAIEADPPMISVGGWNEWIAYKQPYDGEYMLCDAASKEYSRDIEPMAGGYEDAFYLQLISNIRRYKGVSSEPRRNPKTSMDIRGSVTAWDDVEYAQTNLDQSFIARDSYGGSQTVRYTQSAPVDKITGIKVAHDAENIYFYIKCKEKLSSPGDRSNWLNIFIGTGEPALKNWESYEYVIGRSVDGETASVQSLKGDFSAENVGEAEIVRKANIIQLAVPRALMKLDSESQFYFKVAMGVSEPSRIMDTYKTGSVMPMGRLSYMYHFD